MTTPYDEDSLNNIDAENNEQHELIPQITDDELIEEVSQIIRQQLVPQIYKFRELQKKKHASYKTAEEIDSSDRRTIVITNLMQGVSEEDINLLCSKFGNIERITVNSFKFFAYIEFEAIDSVAAAISELNQTQFQGKTIKVSRKRKTTAPIKKKKFKPTKTPYRKK
eukprot:TRINITY_DN595_c0_g1_i1.p1 TRINITY_DN595_c0_g1~~TRINITY_DN595_c0_g1_i1.p1  ORF type:complete len:177 (+),score=45.34 TRINITY_DN595_c0_g1_i1:33-533(+)